MLAEIRNWIRGCFRARPANSPTSSSFEGLEKEWGEELIFSVPRRRRILTEVEDLLIGLPKGDRRDLVTRTALRFALYVVDLPAGGRDQGARPFGLLDHSLAVARAVAGELVRPGFRASEDPAENYREQPIWAYSGFVLGLLHDAGTMLDLDVVAPAGGPAWNPQAEPLWAYLARSGLRLSGPESWHWKKDRETPAPLETLEALSKLLLPAPAKFRLGGRLGRLMRVFRESPSTEREAWVRDPAGRVALVVRRWDQELSTVDQGGKTAGREQPPREASGASPAGGSPKPELSAPGTGPRREASLPSSADSAESRVAPPAAASPHLFPEAVPLAMGDARSLAGASALARPPDPPGVPGTMVRELPDRKIERELQPEQLLRSIRAAIKSATVSRNGSRGPVFVCKDYIWLKYPEAFTRILEHVGIRFSASIGERILQSLLGRPEIASENPRSVLVLGVTPGRGKDPEAFVRFRAEGFFPEEVLTQLGLWPHEIQVPPQAAPRKSKHRQLALWPEGKS